MTDLLAQLPPDPMLERRRLVQATAAKTQGRRATRSALFTTLLSACLALAVVPLFLVIAALIVRGGKVLTWTFLTQAPLQPTIFDQENIGGVGNAIIGSLVVDGVAALMAVPLGIILGLYLAETESRWANGLRRVTEIMTGLPSILLGIFAFIYIVTNMHAYSGFAAAVALAMLMTPVITKAAETALRSVPRTLTEAGLALGARQSKVSLKVVLPVAAPGIITGVLLALARAIGETAPLLFVIGASIRFDWNPFHSMSALPLMTYEYASAAYDSQHTAAWGVGLILVIIVLLLNVSARLIAAFMRRERH